MEESCVESIFGRAESVWSCCQSGIVAIQDLAEGEKRFFASFMPEAVVAIAVCHHVVTMEEWTWYQPAVGHERCEADDHTLEVCVNLQERLKDHGFRSKIVDYPGKSGLQFRFVAQAAGLGKIGRSAFLLHPQWGPWVHLRVLASTTPYEQRALHELGTICTECNDCVEACPAGAIGEESFEGLRCRAYREARGEYIPVGEAQEYHWCTICAQVCLIGEQPNTAR